MTEQDGRRGGARSALLVAGAVVACAGLVTAVALLGVRTMGAGSSDAKGPAPTSPPVSAPPSAPPASPPTTAPSTPAPTSPSAPPPPSPSPSAPGSGQASPVGPGSAPPGYRNVSDEAGFSMAVPAESRRSVEGERIFYKTADGIRVGIKIGKIPPGGALASMRAADAQGPSTNPGYRDNAVRATTHPHGFPAAFWEFTWNGFDRAEGPRHTYDLCWEGNGWLYDVWVSAPTGRTPEARRHFDTAVGTFFPFDH
ncbi:hypothetical protein GPJ59_35110 [Streptomyces bambusae]|uniref:Serine/threonine protein kinase n=1 Tax=Streptomyces bambusae TaxID=1550616 RepID=A0ABS6ZHN3_9ACTN|nr:hypothetical protein [Streptomyces bambusae]